MTEKLRIFKGATELDYAEAEITKTDDEIVNSAKMKINPDSTVTNSSLIDFRKNDGVTDVFTGRVNEIKEVNIWEVKILGNGYELNNIRIEQVYENRSPEYIVQDIIDNYTVNLTYASTTSSGVTLSKYIAKGYLIDVIKDMMTALQWQVRIDESDNFYFEPTGNVDNGVSFTNGTEVQITQWDEDKTDLVNHIRVVGGFENFSTEETVAGTGTTFSLAHKPNGDVRAIVSGSEVDPDTYTVNPDDLEIVFDSSQTDPTFQYSYNRPIIVEDQNDGSIATHGEIFKEVPAPFLDSFPDARQYARQYLEVFSVPQIKAVAVQPGFNFSVDTGELITLTDNVRNKTGKLVVRKLVYNAQRSDTVFYLGSRDFWLYDWQREVESRIKKIERRFINEERIISVRLSKHNLSVDLTRSTAQQIRYPLNSFLLGNESLSLLRASKNYEPDASNNNYGGTWTGTGISGSQYSDDGWRLGSGQFNGSDRILTVSDTADLRITGDLTIAFAIRVDSLPGAETYILSKYDGTDGYAVRITSSNTVELIYSDSGADSTIATTTALTAEEWYHIVFVKNGTALTVYVDGSSDNTDTGGATIGSNTTDLIIGNYSSSYFNGYLDELRIYDNNLSSSNVTSVHSKIDYRTDLIAYYAFDNPLLGDRRKQRINYLSLNSANQLLSYSYDLANDYSTGSTDAYADTTNERILMKNTPGHATLYSTNYEFDRVYGGGKTFNTVTISATEEIFSGDTITYEASADGGNNWENITNNSEHTFTNKGNDIRIRVNFDGFGAQDTYISALSAVLTRN